MDTTGWPGWVFSGLIGLAVAVLTRGAAVKAALIGAHAAPYEAMATRLARLEEERDKVMLEKETLRDQWEEEQEAMKLAWAHERAQVVTSMGAVAHELFQLKGTLSQLPMLVEWADKHGYPVQRELRMLAQQMDAPDIRPRGAE